MTAKIGAAWEPASSVILVNARFFNPKMSPCSGAKVNILFGAGERREEQMMKEITQINDFVSC
jgi:hypothetical protein